MNIDWHIANEIAQWIILVRIWVAICTNNAKIAAAIYKLKKAGGVK